MSPCDRCAHFDGMICGPECPYWGVFLQTEIDRQRSLLLVTLGCIGMCGCIVLILWIWGQMP